MNLSFELGSSLSPTLNFPVTLVWCLQSTAIWDRLNEGRAAPQRSASTGPHILTLGLSLLKESHALSAMEQGKGLRSLPPLWRESIVHMPLPTLQLTSGGWSLDPRQSASMRSLMHRKPAQKSFFVSVWFCAALQKCLVRRKRKGCLHVSCRFLEVATCRFFLCGKVASNMHYG